MVSIGSALEIRKALAIPMQKRHPFVMLGKNLTKRGINIWPVFFFGVANTALCCISRIGHVAEDCAEPPGQLVGHSVHFLALPVCIALVIVLLSVATSPDNRTGENKSRKDRTILLLLAAIILIGGYLAFHYTHPLPIYSRIE